MNRIRFTVDLSERADSLLNAMATEQNTTKAEIVRKALGVYRFLMEEEKKGAKVEISNPKEESVRQLVINPGL